MNRGVEILCKDLTEQGELMICDWLQRLISRPFAALRTQHRRRTAKAHTALEALEARTLLTPFYDLSVLAMTGSFNDFEAFGDLVTITNSVRGDSGFTTPAGTVAFVGFTDLDSNDERESGLWTVGSDFAQSNANPEYSDTNGRDFGRAVDMNESGILTARDRYAGAPAQFFVRSWDSVTDDAHTNIGSANSMQQPDYGQFSGLQTFTDINDRGDIVYIGQSLDVTYRALMIKPVDQEARPFFTMPITPGENSVPRPQLTDDGRVLYRATSSYLALINFETGVAENVAPGFTNIGYSAGISKDGRLVAFIGDNGSGLGVYLSYQHGGAYKTVRIAAVGTDGWSDFDVLDAVRVNNTLLTERGVTVAFEGVHGTLGRGIYTTRVSFIDSEGAIDWDPDYALPYVHGAVPVLRVGEGLGSNSVTDVEFWNGLNDRNRGELAFWVNTSGGERIVRAQPWQVVAVDFAPSGRSLSGFTPTNAALLTQFGVTDSLGWDSNFASAMSAAGISSLTTIDARQDILDQIESYFQDADSRVRVVDVTGTSGPQYVPWSGSTTVPLRTTVRGAFQTILIGAKQATSDDDRGEYGMASPLYEGQGGLDFFNQINDDIAVVFADRIFAINGAFSNPQAAPYDKLVQVIASIAAHEIGHNFGLYHLEDDTSITANEIMRTTTQRDSDLTTLARFSNAAFPREAYIKDEELFTPGSENSIARLKFGVGSIRNTSPPPVPAGPLALAANADSLRANLPYTPTGQGPTTARMLLGIVDKRAGDLLPIFQDLGQGNIDQLLAAARLSVVAGTEVILLGSTDGTRLDIVGVPNGTTFDLSQFVPSFLDITADSRLQASIDPDVQTNGFQLFHVPESGAPVLMGAVAVQNVPEIKVLANGAVLGDESAFGMGETTPGGGPLTRVLTIRNSGSGPLTLGTVVISGTGYSVTQPGQSILNAGQETTITVTLSDGTVGIGIEGQVTIPSDDPAGAFELTLRGTVDGRPRILSVTRIDNGTGPVQVAIDFSGFLQSNGAANADNYQIYGTNGDSVAVATAVYTQNGVQSRVVLTSAVSSSALTSGDYHVRFDGTQVLSATGAPLAATRHNLLSHQVWESIDVVTIGADGSGTAGVLTGPEPTGYSPPRKIGVDDFNSDGIQDFIAISEYTSELVLHLGTADGPYETKSIHFDGPTETIKAAPQSFLIADWNNDGVPDLVVFDRATNNFDPSINRLLVLINDGHGQFTAAPDTPIPVAADAEGTLLGVGDFTGDGHPDIAIAGHVLNAGHPFLSPISTIAVYGKDPFLGYSQASIITMEHSNWAPQAGLTVDVNGDGRLDLIVENGGYFVANPRPTVLLNTPNGMIFAEDLNYDGEGGAIAVQDFTGDGKYDIAIVNDNYSNSAGTSEGGVVSLLVGDGTGQFTALPNYVLNRRGVSLVASGDVNQDGTPDLVLRADPFSQIGYDSTDELSIWVLIGDGFGGFDLSSPMIPLAPTGNITPGNFVLKDITGDGYPELTYGNLASGQFGLLVNDGTGQFIASSAGLLRSTATAFQSHVDQESGIIIADFNRDGFPDQLRVISDVGIFSLQAIDVLWGNADGQFNIVSTINIDSYAYSPLGQYLGDIGFIKVGDLNNDGWLDLIVGGSSGYGSALQIFLGVDGRRFTTSSTLLVDAGANVGVLTGDLADLNGDGNLDFLAVLSTNGAEPTGFGVFYGNGTGVLTFNSNTLQSVPGMQTQIPVLADFNRDGKMDVALGSYGTGDPFDPDSSILIYHGLGNGRFSLGQTVLRNSSDNEPQVYFHDINRDGFIDIVSPNETTLQLDFYLGSTTGQFTAAPDLSVSIPYKVAQLVIADLTGDGFDDIAITQDTSWIADLVTTIPIFAGDGTGHFAEPQLIEVGAIWPKSLALIPVAGTIEAGSFTISRPILSVPSGAVNISTSTKFERPVAINPHPLFTAYTQESIVLAVSQAPSHGTVIKHTNGTPGDLTDDTFVYTPVPGFSGIDQFTYLAVDGRGGTATGIVNITVAPANQSPVLTFSPGALNHFDLYASSFIDLGATITDPDSANFQGGRLVVEISAGFDSEADYLYLENPDDGPYLIEIDYDGSLIYAGTTIGKFTGGRNQPIAITFTSSTVTPAIVQHLLRHIAFSNDAFERPLSSQRTVTFLVADGDGGVSTGSRNILLPAEGSNLAPVVTTTPGSPVYAVGSAAIVIDDAATVSDSDSPHFDGGNLTVDFPLFTIFDDRLAIRTVGTSAGQINLSGNSVRFGTITIGTYSGGFINSSPLVIQFNSNATPVAVQALLRQITFANIDGENPYTDTRTIRFVINDGSGGVSAPATRTIPFLIPNGGAEIDLSNGTTDYPGDQSVVTIDDAVFVSDFDSDDFGGGSLTVDFVSGHSSFDRIAIRNEGTLLGQINLSGNTIKFGSITLGTFSGGFTSNSALVISLNTNASPARTAMLIRQLTFQVATPSPTTADRVIRFVINDGDGGISLPALKTITMSDSGANDAPVIQLSSGSPTFSKFAAPLAIDPQAIVIGPGSGTGTIGGGVLTISINDVSTGKKRVTFDLFNLNALNVVGTSRGTQLINGRLVTVFDIDAGTTAQAVQNALRNVTFQTSKKSMKFASRNVQIKLADSEGDVSTQVTKTINVSKKRVR